jgi:hypothetical protein
MTQPQLIKRYYISDRDAVHLPGTFGYRYARLLSYQHSGWHNLGNRLHLAWLVFIGRCDVLDWEDDL